MPALGIGIGAALLGGRLGLGLGRGTLDVANALRTALLIAYAARII